MTIGYNMTNLTNNNPGELDHKVLSANYKVIA